MKAKKLIGFIPAGGEGLRMRPLTNNLPKALILIDGIPLIQYAIDSLESLGVEKIIIATNYLANKIELYVKHNNFKSQIIIVKEDKKRLGLPFALANARKYLTSDFVVFCPDMILSNPADLQSAQVYFLKYQPLFLQINEIGPPRYNNRIFQYSKNMKQLAPNLFLSGLSKSNSGLAMGSTGISFHSSKTLNYLPDFEYKKTELPFSQFLKILEKKGKAISYLMRGCRFDFTDINDIKIYSQRKNRIKRLTKCGVSIILINQKGQVLLHLRDNIPQISFPNFWALIGGGVEEGENIYQAIEREVKEEIGFNLKNYSLLREFGFKGKKEYAFVGEIDVRLDQLNLTEGQAIKFYQPSEFEQLKVRPDDYHSLKLYYDRDTN